MGIKFKPYQEKTIEFGVKSPYSIYALDMGLGKTVTALETVFRAGSQRIIVVCPAYLTINWVNEIKKFYPQIKALRVKSGKEIPPKFGDLRVIVMSYELATKAGHLFERASAVISDEAQNLKSMKAKRTEHFHRFVFENSVERLHLLTGTPIKNRIEEYYSLIALCHYRPDEKMSDFLDRFPDASTFADHFSHRVEREINVGYRRVKLVTWEGAKNVDELKRYLKPIYIRFSADKVLDLPPITHIEHVISEDEDSFLAEAFEEFDEKNGSVLPKYKAQATLKKVPYTVEYTEGLLESGVKHVLVYTDHVATAQALAEKLKCPFITGEVPLKIRAFHADEFQRGAYKVLVATIGSFSTGVTLTKSQDVVFNDFGWTPGDNDQVIGRIRRIGQTGTCRAHWILGSPQDKYIREKVIAKARDISRVV